jgi:regulator of PEP synthase PpsR (kinase-PPPase family)
VKDLVVKVERLKGERDLLVGESRKEKEKYAASADIHEELNVYQTLFMMDPQKYG